VRQETRLLADFGGDRHLAFRCDTHPLLLLS
jgi:hypothetical protein